MVLVQKILWQKQTGELVYLLVRFSFTAPAFCQCE